MKKFFNEMDKCDHLDKRYGKANIPNKHDVLVDLLRQTHSLFELNRIPCIIMHGSLIGWYFYEDAAYDPNDFHSDTPSYINHYNRPTQ